MIPLAIYCIFGGCLTAPIDTRPIHRQIIQDQLTPSEITSCYHGDTYYKDCRDANPFGFNLDDEDEHSRSRWSPRNRD